MKQKLPYILTGLILLVYAGIRMWKVDATYDEVWTWQTFVPLGFMEILNCTPCDANNHILNTLLIKFFIWLGGDNLFIMRLPALLGFAFYLYFSARIALRFLTPLMGICFFILSWSNPFLLDFFSLARGYGISLGFIMASLYFLLDFLKRLSLRSSAWSLSFGALSVLSNLSTLNFYLSLIAVLLLYALIKARSFISPQSQIRNPQFHFLKLFYRIFAISFILFAILYEPVRKLSSQGNFYYGGVSGFYDDTLMSLTAFSLGKPYEESAIVPLVLNILISVFIIVLLLSVLPGKGKKLSFRLFILFIVLIPVLSGSVQFLLFRTPYLIDRTAIFYYPLFVLVFSVWSDAGDGSKVRNFLSGGMITTTIAFLVNFILNANFFKTITWPHDSRTTEILDYLQEEAERQKASLKFDSSWPFEKSLQYHLEKGTYHGLIYVKQSRNVVEKDAEYFLYFNKSLDKVVYNSKTQPILHLEKDTVLTYPEEGITLFKLIKQ